MEKIYVASRSIKLPRIVELIMHLTAFLLILFCLHYLKIDYYVFDTKFEINDEFFLIVMSIAFIVYRMLTTPTIVEELRINSTKKGIEFIYVFFFLFRRKLTVSFSEFSFYSKLDSIICGGALSLMIFKGNRFKIKLNHRYGWSRKQIYCINRNFLIITNGYTRKESKWEEFYKLVKEKDTDCSDVSL